MLLCFYFVFKKLSFIFSKKKALLLTQTARELQQG